MDISIIILAAIAVLVISRLYAVLGQKTGAEPARRFEKPAPRPAEREAETPSETDDKPRLRAAFTGPAAAGLEAIAAVDNQFDPDDFIKGARRAYELIVNAFADGDRDALKQLVDDDVFEAYTNAITEREKAGTEPMRLARVKSARIADASVDATSMARVQVSFEAELSDSDRMRTAREIWTFKRQLNSNNPNWLLDEVATAS
ncbi:MAG TPA: Tim44/TimA family putative adaptor protein [Hyphomonadaceae bacterium]|nr:Tim44/TimA family putative adaptor protein [Hyphomonadaceae bacterium]